MKTNEEINQLPEGRAAINKATVTALLQEFFNRTSITEWEEILFEIKRGNLNGTPRKTKESKELSARLAHLETLISTVGKTSLVRIEGISELIFSYKAEYFGVFFQYAYRRWLSRDTFSIQLESGSDGTEIFTDVIYKTLDFLEACHSLSIKSSLAS